tara:strand:+ start:114238 stop:115803 length:1566 start_codon:yes stop_codon:yes gene_type:complete
MQRIRYIKPLLLFAIILTDCTDSKQNSENSSQPLEEIDQFKIAIDEFTFIDEELLQKSKDSCLTFYNSRDFKPVWFSTNKIKDSSLRSFYNYINNDTLLNIPLNILPDLKATNNDDKWTKEVIAYHRISLYLSLREIGVFNFKDTTLNEITLSSNHKISSFVDSKNDSTSWIDHLISFNTENINIPLLHKAINDFTKEFGIDDLNCKIDTASQIKTTNKCLDQLGYDISKDSTSNLKSLKNFQYNNGLVSDGVIGKNTIKALEKSNFERYTESIITLDMLHQFADSVIPNKIIRVNIPTFLLSFYNKDTLAFRSKVVVGAQKTKTPTFKAKAKYIVTNPYWYVPHSIATKEILYSVRKDSLLFEKKGYELLKNREVIDIDSIDFSRYHKNYFPFQIRQKYGPLNSLGKVKLLFPNKNMVYIHDTPSKRLFNTSVRAYSHGCIRTQYPDSLTKLILQLEDHTYLDSIDTLYSRDKETYLELHDNFYVSIEYQTAVYDDSTRALRVFPDIYGRLSDFVRISRK